MNMLTKLDDWSPREWRDVYASLLAISDDAIVSLDESQRIVVFNHGAERLFGYATGETRGEPIEMLIPERFRERHHDYIEKFAMSGVTSRRMGERGEIVGRRKDGTEFPAEGSISWLEAEGHRVFTIVLRDISERKRAEAAITSMNAELEKQVADRTAELSATNAELEAFCYSVSHDLRAPLRSMDGFAQAVIEDCGDALDAVGLDYLKRINAASGRMGRIIDDLLRLSRVTRSDLNRSVVDLSDLANSICTELQSNDPGRRIRFDIEADLVARADERLLRIALENLLANAWKFTSTRHEANIEVGKIVAGVDGGFFVRDNGTGFDMAYAGNLFEPFQRLHSSRKFEGIGIGLATVQRIVNRHGGRVWAESVLDDGTTIYVTL